MVKRKGGKGRGGTSNKISLASAVDVDDDTREVDVFDDVDKEDRDERDKLKNKLSRRTHRGKGKDKNTEVSGGNISIA